MISIHHEWHSPIRNLPKLLKAYNLRGGSIVEFQRVVACILYAQKSSHYVWVPPNGSAVLRSLPDTLSTLLFGWWSISGFFWTIGALITNLGGGRDATDELLRATRGGNVAFAQQALDDEIRERRQQSIRALGQFAGIVVGIVVVFGGLTKITEWYMGRADSQRAAAAQRAAQSPATRYAATANAARTPAMAVQPVNPLQVQAIFFSPNGGSTAIVNRQTVSVGQVVAGYTVLGIEPQSVNVRSPNGKQIVLRVIGSGR